MQAVEQETRELHPLGRKARVPSCIKTLLTDAHGRNGPVFALARALAVERGGKSQYPRLTRQGRAGQGARRGPAELALPLTAQAAAPVLLSATARVTSKVASASANRRRMLDQGQEQSAIGKSSGKMYPCGQSST